MIISSFLYHCLCGKVIHFTDTEGKEVCPKCHREIVLDKNLKSYLEKSYAKKPDKFIETRPEA